MTLKVLVIDDEKLIGWSLKKDLEKEGYQVSTAQTLRDGQRLFEEENPDAVLLDLRLPDGSGKDFLGVIRKKDPWVSVIVITANEDVRSAVECMQHGAFTYLHKPFEFDEVRINLEKALEAKRLRQRVAAFESTEKGRYDFQNIISESAKMKAVIQLASKVIDSEASTILIEGESGTGKDLLARSIHYAGKRASRPFVPINCAAIPATLLETELFGHEKGAFTDARDAKKGLVEEASGGTLFLDEIGDMSRDLQAKLLHLIDQKKFRKVGGVRELDAEIRVIAATNKDLKKEVSEGRFREDLYYRLRVFPIFIPPLRERKEDVRALVGFFIALFNREMKRTIKSVEPMALDILANYSWPGNVRELKNVIERAMILCHDDVIRSEHLPTEIDCQCVLKNCNPMAGADGVVPQLPRCLGGFSLEAIEKQAIVLALEQADGNQTKAAKVLDVGRDALRYKMQKYGLLAPETPAETSK